MSNLYVVENFDLSAANDAASKRFGLVNMGFHGDICADIWHDNYEGAPRMAHQGLVGIGAMVSELCGVVQRMSTLGRAAANG